VAGFQIWGLFATGETGGLRNRARTGSPARGKNRPEPLRTGASGPSGRAHPAEERAVPAGRTGAPPDGRRRHGKVARIAEDGR